MTRKSIKQELMDAQLEVELDQAKSAELKMSAEQKETQALAMKLIALSRDMRRPGSALSEGARIERLIKVIRDEEA
jgi:hypothetical protein